MDKRSWIPYSICEGGGLGGLRWLFVLLAAMSPTPAHILFAIGCAGITQMVLGGASLLWARTLPKFSGWWHLLAPMALGLGGLAANSFGVAAFLTVSRADMAASTFIATVPVILLTAAHGYFRCAEPWALRQWTAVLIVVCAALLMMPIAVFSTWSHGVPIWALYSFLTAVFAAANECISIEMAQWERRNAKPKLDPGTLQITGGLTTGIAGFLGFCLFARAQFGAPSAEIISVQKLWVLGASVGCCNFFWWRCRLRSYQLKAPVSIRRFPTIGISLLTATVIGHFVFNEMVPGRKLLSIVLYAPAFFFATNDSEKWLMPVWKYLYWVHDGLRGPFHREHGAQPSEITIVAKAS